MSPFALHLSGLGHSGGAITPHGGGSVIGSTAQQVAYKVNFKPLHEQTHSSGKKVKKQPTQLNISTITPKPVDKRVSPSNKQNVQPPTSKKVFSNIIDSAESLEKQRVEQM